MDESKWRWRFYNGQYVGKWRWRFYNGQCVGILQCRFNIVAKDRAVLAMPPFRAVVLASRNFLIRMIRCDGECAVGKIAQELMLQGGLESDTPGPGQHAPTAERTI